MSDLTDIESTQLGETISGEIISHSEGVSIGQVGGNIDTVGGDFIGREPIPVISGDIVHGDKVSGDKITIVQNYPVVPTEKLRGRLTRAISFADALSELEIIGMKINRQEKNILTNRFQDSIIDDRLIFSNQVQQQLISASNDLIDIESTFIVPIEIQGEEESYRQQQILNALSAEVNIMIGRLHIKSVGYVRAAAGSPQIAKTMSEEIGNSDLKVMANSHVEAIETLWAELNIENLTQDGFDFLSDMGVGAINILTEIENRKSEILALTLKDKRRNNFTVAIVIAYIVFIIGLTILLIWRLSSLPPSDQAAFESLELPLIGIPASVITWSLIGSFAAMIIRFNREPIYNFGYTVKWLLTRPVQGVILGAAFYIVLVSGLFLISQQIMGGTESGSSGSLQTEIILVLVFLVGFSDRFADSVFENLLERFSGSQTMDTQ